jgi:hypothetical protein
MRRHQRSRDRDVGVEAAVPSIRKEDAMTNMPMSTDVLLHEPLHEHDPEELLEDSLEEMIRRRAYERYLARGGEPGWELDDWLAAERELSEEREEEARGE